MLGCVKLGPFRNWRFARLIERLMSIVRYEYRTIDADDSIELLNVRWSCRMAIFAFRIFLGVF
jgi:hypothetical protein